MPVAHMAVDDSTLVLTSVVMSAITFGFCASVGIKPITAIVIAIVVGVILYSIGVIPVGIIAVVGFSMVVAMFKMLFSNGNKPKE